MHPPPSSSRDKVLGKEAAAPYPGQPRQPASDAAIRADSPPARLSVRVRPGPPHGVVAAGFWPVRRRRSLCRQGCAGPDRQRGRGAQAETRSSPAMRRPWGLQAVPLVRASAAGALQ